MKNMRALKVNTLEAAIDDALAKLDPGHTPVKVEEDKDDATGVESVVIHLNSTFTSSWRMENIIKRICTNPYPHVSIACNASQGLYLMVRKSTIKAVYFNETAE